MSLRIGLVGGGGITETHARAARDVPGVDIVAIAGSDEARVRRLCRDYGGMPFASFDAFLDHAGMDLVIIGSPSGFHAAQGIAAAERGLHLLVEKPLDITTERVDALLAAVERAGVRLGVIFQDRTRPDLQRAKRLIESGARGRRTLVEAIVPWYRPPSYYAESRWRGTWALDGGGALMNQGIHTVDLMLWLVGDVVRLQGRAVTRLHAIEVEDTAAATLEFENGAVGVLATTTTAYPGQPRRLMVAGSDGTLVIEQDRLMSLDIAGSSRETMHGHRPGDDERASSPLVSDVEGHRAVLEDFSAAVQSGARPLCDGRDGRRSVALVEALYRSSRTNGWIDVPRDPRGLEKN
jgi:UDP-N-acetyl-2-amino-2-deoxyglucuronate dehydrogenase